MQGRSYFLLMVGRSALPNRYPRSSYSPNQGSPVATGRSNSRATSKSIRRDVILPAWRCPRAGHDVADVTR